MREFMRICLVFPSSSSKIFHLYCSHVYISEQLMFWLGLNLDLDLA